MQTNFNTIFKKISYKNYQFAKVCKYVDIETRILIYKQTVLPLVEYVSFMMCLNNKHDIEKLQRLQNRSLRLCYNINTPTEITTVLLHENAKLEKLCDRRNVALMCIMYDLCRNRMYEKVASRVTRAADGYTFDLTVPHMGVYAKSPYYVGANMWNVLPLNIRNSNTKAHFKYEIKDRLKRQ